MPTALIIGSGPGAAGVALALAEDPTQQITVIDVGHQLEDDLESVRAKLASTDESDWSAFDVERISRQPVETGGSTLPQKRAFGSDFPFRDVGQLAGVRAVGASNPSVVSGAYGGFSNVWGAQIMPFSRATFDRWPITFDQMESHYRVALDEMTLAGDSDDLAELFPLLVAGRRLPPLTDRTHRVLHRYGQHRAQVKSHGITIGRARLAFRADTCSLCGLCMTGCPHQLVYSASHTFDRLRSDGRITYRPGLLAIRLDEDHGVPVATVRNLSTDATDRLTADRIFVACGALGTTRLILGSLGRYDSPITLQESVQFIMPTLSARPTEDPRQAKSFTLNQFNLLYDHTGEGVDLCHIHFYDYNPAFLASLPPLLRAPGARPLLANLLRRISVGLGYVPGWASPGVKITAQRPDGSSKGLAGLVVDREGSDGWPPMLTALIRAFLHVAPALDLWPVLPMLTVSAAAKSYHFGSSFPHSAVRTSTTTDRQGRLDAWDNIHLVDASVFPNVPATTFTLTIMANAHRIASEALRSSQ
jgi:NAD-dependent dihydropyrimidine dehydrogenase PreA subunit